MHDWRSFVLGGNSIGGFTSMSAAASDLAPLCLSKQGADGTDTKDKKVSTVTSSGAPGTGKCVGLVLINSAGPIFTQDEIQSMLDKAQDDLQRASVAQITALDALPPCSPPPQSIARIFGNGLLAYLRPNINSICKNLYPTNTSAVDDNLCQNILRDSLDPGAINVMMAGAKLPPPRSANELLQSDFHLGSLVDDTLPQEAFFDGPVLIAQGVLDPLNDARDRMERFGSLRCGIVTNSIQGGHCPHDELPNEVAKIIVRWSSSLITAKTMTYPPRN